jgi:hypothetical protein
VLVSCGRVSSHIWCLGEGSTDDGVRKASVDILDDDSVLGSRSSECGEFLVWGKSIPSAEVLLGVKEDDI